ncbi:MAG: hypothetical protein ACI9DK_000973 [Vicingaceae bacterium]|jgi:hypothetical protein
MPIIYTDVQSDSFVNKAMTDLKNLKFLSISGNCTVEKFYAILRHSKM